MPCDPFSLEPVLGRSSGSARSCSQARAGPRGIGPMPLGQAPNKGSSLQPIGSAHRMSTASMVQLQPTREIAPTGREALDHAARSLGVGPQVISRLQDAQAPGCDCAQPMKGGIGIGQKLLHLLPRRLRRHPVGKGLHQLPQGLGLKRRGRQRCGPQGTAVVGHHRINPWVHRGGPQGSLATSGVAHDAQEGYLMAQNAAQSFGACVEPPGPNGHGRPDLLWPALVDRAQMHARRVIAGPLRPVDPCQGHAVGKTVPQRRSAHHMRPASIGGKQNRGCCHTRRPSQAEVPMDPCRFTHLDLPPKQGIPAPLLCVCKLDLQVHRFGRHGAKGPFSGLERRPGFRRGWTGFIHAEDSGPKPGPCTHPFLNS